MPGLPLGTEKALMRSSSCMYILASEWMLTRIQGLVGGGMPGRQVGLLNDRVRHIPTFSAQQSTPKSQLPDSITAVAVHTVGALSQATEMEPALPTQ